MSSPPSRATNRDEKGFVLLTVVIFTFILFALATRYTWVASQELYLSQTAIRDIQANEIARAGLAVGLEKIRRGERIPTEGHRQQLENGVALIIETPEGSDNKWRLSSTGYLFDEENPASTATITAVVDATAQDAAGAVLAYREGQIASGEKR